MARILFIIPRTQGRFGKPSTPHVGISYLASYVKAHGHDPSILDLRVAPMELNDIREQVNTFKADYLGITSVSLEYKFIYDFINKLINFGVPVIYGGPHVSVVKEEIFNGCNPYAAVYGEGEETLREILDNKPLSDINGIIFKDSSGKVVVNPSRERIHNLDTIPFPDFSLSNMERYSERKIPLTTSRDCPYNCTYCNVKLVMGKGFRKRSPENVVAEIEEWYTKGYRLFGINDDTFTSDMKRARRVCELIIEKKLDISWELRTGIRVDRVSEPLLKIMKQSGCHFLAYGIESVNDEVLENVKKSVSFEQIKKAVVLTEKVGIPFSGFFMIGLPGDTFEKFTKLHSFVKTRKFNEVRFYNLMPYPNTEAFQWIKENGTFLEKPEEYLNNATRLQSEPVFVTNDFSRKERVKAYNMGESIMVQLLLKKTIGKTIGALLSPFCEWSPIRKFILTMGFRFTSFARKLQDRVLKHQKG